MSQIRQVFSTLPEVPKAQRPKRLWHCGATEEETSFLVDRGWEPSDLRLLPCETDAERAVAVKARLEAIRMGTVEAPSREVLTALQVEAKICGLMTGKGVTMEDAQMSNDTLDSLLSFNKRRTLGK